MRDEYIGTTVEVRSLTPNEIWEEKDEWYGREEKSLAMWNNFTPDQQKIARSVTANAISSLLIALDEWLPTALVKPVGGGDCIDVAVRILIGEIDDQVRLNDVQEMANKINVV